MFLKPPWRDLNVYLRLITASIFNCGLEDMFWMYSRSHCRCKEEFRFPFDYLTFFVFCLLAESHPVHPDHPGYRYGGKPHIWSVQHSHHCDQDYWCQWQSPWVHHWHSRSKQNETIRKQTKYWYDSSLLRTTRTELKVVLF